jgi:hypothetical protein
LPFGTAAITFRVATDSFSMDPVRAWRTARACSAFMDGLLAKK